MRIISLADARARHMENVSLRPALPSYAEVMIALIRLHPDTIVGRYPLATYFGTAPLPPWAQAFTFLLVDQGPMRPLTAGATLRLLRLPVVTQHVGLVDHETCYHQRFERYCPVVGRGHYVATTNPQGVYRFVPAPAAPTKGAPAYRDTTPAEHQLLSGMAAVRAGARRLASIVMEGLVAYGTLHTGLPSQQHDHTTNRRSA